ncbi:MAG TPA: ATP-binding protein, partial [Terriglobia bacterium]|nr:ATP-binding protein [Terriglobia bacterium]
KKIKISKKYDMALPPIPLDLVRMMQVFTNLYLNAVQAVEEGGRLSVRTGQERIDGKLYLTVAIRDNGVGISPAQQATIFDPFYTTKSDGIGLGLTIVKKIVEQHKGRISLKSKLGEYSVFSVYLPVKA